MCAKAFSEGVARVQVQVCIADANRQPLTRYASSLSRPDVVPRSEASPLSLGFGIAAREKRRRVCVCTWSFWCVRRGGSLCGLIFRKERAELFYWLDLGEVRAC